MRKPWKNVGMPWWRRRWETSHHGTHVWAWTEAGAKRKAARMIKKGIK